MECNIEFIIKQKLVLFIVGINLIISCFAKYATNLEINVFTKFLCGLTFTSLWADSVDDWDIFLIFPRKQDLTFHADCLLRRQLESNVKSFFSRKNEKNISICHLLKFLPNMLSVKVLGVLIFDIQTFVCCSFWKDCVCVLLCTKEYSIRNVNSSQKNILVINLLLNP